MPVDFHQGDIIETIHVKQFAGPAYYGETSTGTSAAYAVSIIPEPEGGYVSGMLVNFRLHAANAANPTLNLNSLGPKAIVRRGGVALTAGELLQFQVVSLVYDGTSQVFHLVGAGGGGGSLNDLNDVSISSPTVGQVLRKSAGDWVNSALAGTDITTGQVALARGGTGRDNSGNNVALGTSALNGLSSGASNTALGPSAGSLITTGSFNIAVGQQALAEAGSKTGSNNVALGYLTLGNASSGHGNVAIGHTSLRNVSSGFRCVAIGDSAMRALTTGNSNVGIGYLALDKITTQSGNTALGVGAGFNLTSGQFNTLIGHQICYSGAGATGNHNVGLGYNALFSLTSGAENVAIGAFALNTSQSESQCVAIGHQAGYNLSGGSVGANVFLGWLAGRGTPGCSASHTVAVGYNSLVNVTSGTENTALGSQTLPNLSTGQRNLALGRTAGQFVTTGSNNTLVGDGAGSNLTTGSHNVVIGSGISVQSVSESQQVNVANAFRRSGSQGASSVTSKAAGYASGSSTALLNLANRRGRIEFFDSNNDWAVVRFLGTTLILESGSANYVLSASPGASEVGLSASGNTLTMVLGSSAARNVGWVSSDIEF